MIYFKITCRVVFLVYPYNHTNQNFKKFQKLHWQIPVFIFLAGISGLTHGSRFPMRFLIGSCYSFTGLLNHQCRTVFWYCWKSRFPQRYGPRFRSLHPWMNWARSSLFGWHLVRRFGQARCPATGPEFWEELHWVETWVGRLKKGILMVSLWSFWKHLRGRLCSSAYLFIDVDDK